MIIKINYNKLINYTINQQNLLPFSDMFKIIKENLLIKNIQPTEEDFYTWQENLKNNKLINTLVLHIGPTLAGYLQYTVDDDNIFINEIQISSKYQGDGYTFRKLMMELLKNKNFGCVKLNINPDNKQSISVFTGIGFKTKNNKLYIINKEKLDLWLNKNS